MGKRWTKPERLIVALLAAVAALTFFFPLLSIRLPIAGDEDVTVYDTASRARSNLGKRPGRRRESDARRGVVRSCGITGPRGARDPFEVPVADSPRGSLPFLKTEARPGWRATWALLAAGLTHCRDPCNL